jgi:adenosine deaminase
MEFGQQFKARVEFWRSFPKIELHRHIEGSARLSTLNQWQKQDSNQNITLEQTASELLITQPMADLSTVLHRFLHTRDLINTPARITQLTYEIIEDSCYDGIKILELRYSPTYLSEGQNFNWEQGLEAINQGIQKASHLPIAVGLIGIIQRTVDMKLSARALEFIETHHADFIGLDLADNEGFRKTADFETLFKNRSLPLTVHAGESPGGQENVRDAILKLGADRIGHGLQIMTSPDIQHLVAEKKIGLELCPTSNFITSAIQKIDDLPIRSFLNSGIVCSLNSDDPGIFDITLSHEYALCEKSFGFSETEFRKLNNHSKKMSFINDSVKNKFWP